MAKKKPAKKEKKLQPLWDWTIGITQSSLTQFLACREQFALNYVEGWTPRGFSVPLEFGNLTHAMIQNQASSFSPEKVAAKVCLEYEAGRKSQLGSDDDYQQMQKTMVAAQALFPRYVRFWKKDDAKQEWLHKERVFKVEHSFTNYRGKYLTTDWLHSHYPMTVKVNLHGMRDGEYRTVGKKELGLFETKTRSSIDDMAIHSGLRADLQTMFYLWSLYLEYGEYPTECLYNIIRRPGLVYNPKKETLKEYGERVGADIDERPDYYFRRWHITVLQQDLQKFIQITLDPALRQMYEWWESVKKDPLERFNADGAPISPYHFANLNALSTKYGKAPLYDLMILGNRTRYFRRSSLFPELQGGIAA